MAIHRYWRLTGFCVDANGPLELSEARLYAAGGLADAAATLTATATPALGALADLKDGVASAVVSWPYAAYTQSGFALVWDFGAAGAVDITGLRLGSGSGAATWPRDLVLQWSDDARAWTTDPATGIMREASYPGPMTLTAIPGAFGGDPYFANVSLLLHMAGAHGSISVLDSSPANKTLTATGGAHISTVQSKFGGSSLALDGSGDYLSMPNQADLRFASGDFTLEMWVWPASVTAVRVLCYQREAGGAGWGLLLGSDGSYYLQCTSGAPSYITSAAGVMIAGVWQHVAVTRQAGVLRLFHNGILKATSSAPGISASTATPFFIGRLSDGSYEFAGYIDELRITGGVARYTDAFSPPAAAFVDYQFPLLAQDLIFSRNRQWAPLPARMLPAVALPASTASGHLREYPFFDAYNGGLGTVAGTVKEKSTPTNTPLRRRVLLIDEASRITIRETWSDAVTGNYAFRGVRQGVKYTVVSYDHTGAYRAVVADAQEPVVIA